MADFAQTNCYQYLKFDTKHDSQKNKSQQQMAVRLAKNHKPVLRFLRKAENFQLLRPTVPQLEQEAPICGSFSILK